MASADFDFTKQVVITSPINGPLTSADNMHLSIIRGGLHVTGRSDGTSLVLLPQQFSNCLHATDSRVHLIRADLMLTGMVFTDVVDTDIRFDFGLFSPRCRLMDRADVKQMQLTIAPTK